MSKNGALINLGELSKPVTVLIEKISDAIGGVFKPSQIRRVAQAEAEAEKIGAATQIEISELQHRAMCRFFAEEASKQLNIENIIRKAIPNVGEQSRPDQVENDWITNFFDQCRLISDEEMQCLWANILAGEANSPGRYSKRTVDCLSSLDKTDAELFSNLCGYAWLIQGQMVPLVFAFDIEDDIYSRGGVFFSTLKHLGEIGLASFEGFSGFQLGKLPSTISVSYYGVSVAIGLGSAGTLDIGNVALSRTGMELASICGSTPVAGFKEYILKRWRERGYKLSLPDAEGQSNDSDQT